MKTSSRVPSNSSDRQESRGGAGIGVSLGVSFSLGASVCGMGDDAGESFMVGVDLIEKTAAPAAECAEKCINRGAAEHGYANGFCWRDVCSNLK